MAETVALVDGGVSKPALVAGAWVAALMAVAAGVGLGIGVITPPRSGDFCVSDCLVYPYANVAAFVPADYLWMYPALVACLLLVAVAAFAGDLPGARAPFARVATAFAAISAAILATDYLVQLTVVQPSLVKGETDGLALLSMYNPHGLAIGLEDAGYFVMGAAFLALAAALPLTSRLARAAIVVLAIGGGLLVAALPAMGAAFGADLGYRFEVFAISVGWGGLIVAGAMLSAVFRRGARELRA
jgi:hypothetical protein